jgi:hypothetical protein
MLHATLVPLSVSAQALATQLNVAHSVFIGEHWLSMLPHCLQLPLPSQKPPVHTVLTGELPVMHCMAFVQTTVEQSGGAGQSPGPPMPSGVQPMHFPFTQWRFPAMQFGSVPIGVVSHWWLVHVFFWHAGAVGQSAGVSHCTHAPLLQMPGLPLMVHAEPSALLLSPHLCAVQVAVWQSLPAGHWDGESQPPVPPPPPMFAPVVLALLLPPVPEPDVN